MGSVDYPISLTIKAIDKATEPLRAINAKIAAFNAPFAKIGNSFKELGEASGLMKLGERTREVGSALGEVGKSVFELGEKLLTMEAVGAFALFEIAKGAAESASELKNNAERVGMTVDEYASMSFAAKQAHVSQDEFTNSIDKFNKNLGLLRANSGPLVEFLGKVSPKLLQQVRATHTTREALELMTKAFVVEKDEQKRAILGQELFGKSSKNMAMFLGQGSAAIKEQMANYIELAGSQEKFANGGEEAEKAINATEASFMGLRNAAAAELFPALTELFRGIAKLVSGNRDGIKKWAETTGKAISSWVEGGGLDRLGKNLSDIASTVGKVIDALGGLKGVATLAAVWMGGGLLKSVLGLGSALWGLVPAITQVGVSLYAWTFGPVIASIATFVEALGLGFTALEAMQLAFAPFVIAAAPFILAAVGIGAAAYEIYKNWGDIKFFFKDLWNSIVFYATQAWDKIKPIVEAMAGTAKMIFNAPGDALKTAKDFYFSNSNSSPAPTLGASQTPSPAGAGTAPQRSEAKITVDFKNAPKGTRVTKESDGVAVDHSLGYNHASPS